MDPLIWTVKNLYLPYKLNESLKEMKSQTKRSLPVLIGDLKEDRRPSVRLANAVNHQCGRLKYKHDPMNGLIDRYTHPEHIQWILETGNYDKTPAGVDCDDFASYAISLFLKAGVNPDHVWEWNMVVPFFNQFTQAKYNHVICGFSLVDANEEEWVGVIDTNTAHHKKIVWVNGSKEESKDEVLAHFRNIYPANYYALIEPNKLWQAEV